MLTIRVKKYGRVFEPNVIQNHVIGVANKRILEYGLTTVQSLTPVRTGTARDGWYTDRKTTIANDVPYVPFIEYGTRYIVAKKFAQRTAEMMANKYGVEITARLQSL